MTSDGLTPLVDRSSLVDEEDLLESFSLIANIDKAWCRGSPVGQATNPKAKGNAPGKASLDISVLMSQRNLPGNSMRKYLSSVHIPDPQGDLSLFHWPPFPVEMAGAASVVPSPSGARLLVVRNGEAGGGAGGKEPGPVKLEVWGAGRLLREVQVAAAVHGAVYTDGWFEGISWSDDETSVAYIAEEAARPRPVFGLPRKSAANAAAAAAAASANQHAPAAPANKARGRYGADAAAAAAAGSVSAAGSKGKNGASGGASPEAGTWKGYGEWEEDWGERYVGKRRPLVFVMDTTSGTVTPIEGIPEDLSVGQVVWAPAAAATGNTSNQQQQQQQQQSVVFVGWPAYATNFSTPRRLGMVYCYNRPCALYAATVPPAPDASAAAGRKSVAAPSIVKLTDPISSAYSPRFSPDGSLLVFLSSHAAVDSGAHAATNSMHSLAWPKEGIVPPPTSEPAGVDMQSGEGPSPVPTVDIPLQVVIDVVARAEEPGGFPGLYASSCIASPWLADGRTLLLTTAWRSTQTIIAVHVESGRVSRLTPEGPISWVLLDVRNNVVVAGASTPACPTKLMLGRVNAGWLKQEGWLWSEISPPHVEYAEPVENALKSTEFEVISVLPSNPKAQGNTEGAKQAYEAIFVRRQPDSADPAAAAAGSKAAAAAAAASSPASLPPLLVVPHGGPHGVTVTSFAMPYAYLCALGYAVLHVNYRGSVGFGEEALQSLPRNVGKQDVSDMLEAIDRVVELGYVDASRMAVIGGSHGGFLAAHLIGQEPDRFRTAVLRNPVTNLASMVGVSDIPDWCYVETFGAAGVAGFRDAPSAADMAAFLKASPIAYVGNVKVPTLTVLGGKDLRVPHSNGLEYVHALRAQGLEARVLMMPEDVHAIDKPQSEYEQWLTVASWLKQYL